MSFASCGNRNLSHIVPYPTIGINDQGQIIGTGDNATGQENGFLPSPVPEPATIIVWSLLGVGSWLGMRVVRQRRGGPVGRQPWSNENRAAIHNIIARGAHR